MERLSQCSNLSHRSNNSFEMSSLEFALFDAIDNVCQFLNVKDLGRVAQVSKSWHAAATREIANRGHIQRLLIPRNLEDSGNYEFQISKALNVKPHVALLFFSAQYAQENLTSTFNYNHYVPTRLEVEVESFYSRYFPRKLIAIETTQCLTDEDAKFNSPDLNNQFALESTGNNSIHGLFLPLHRQIKINVAWSKGCIGTVSEVANKMIDKLGYNEAERLTSMLIVFSYTLKGYFISNQIIRTIRRRFENDNKETIWGGIFNKGVVATNCKSEKNKTSQKAFVGLRIAGSNLKSWCAIIDCNTKKREVDQKLLELKEAVNRKRCTVGLAYGPSKIGHLKNSYKKSDDLMRGIRKIFGNIPFVGLFDRECTILIGDDSLHDETSQKLSHHKYMSLIILAYD